MNIEISTIARRRGVGARGIVGYIDYYNNAYIDQDGWAASRFERSNASQITVSSPMSFDIVSGGVLWDYSPIYTSGLALTSGVASIAKKTSGGTLNFVTTARLARQAVPTNPSYQAYLGQNMATVA